MDFDDDLLAEPDEGGHAGEGQVKSQLRSRTRLRTAPDPHLSEVSHA
jgi:hypothetical protein